MDIRNYFSAKPQGGRPDNPGGGKPKGKEQKKQESEKQKRKMVISSSDEDEPKPPKKAVKAPANEDDDFKPEKKHSSKPSKQSPPKTKLKEVTASEFFGKPSVASKMADKPILDDTPSKKRKADDDAFDRACSSTPFSPKNTKKQRAEESPSLSSKLADKAKKHSESSKHIDSHGKSAEKSSKHSKSSEHSKSREKTPSKEIKTKTPSKSPRERSKEKEKDKTPAKTHREKSKEKEKSKTPKKDLDESVSELPSTPQEDWEQKKKHRQAAYQKFLTRGGAKHPGSKSVPEGTPGCFNGLTFVLTGVYESLEREEMSEIIKSYGGKTTTSVSKNTSYLVVGEQAGESKLEKGRKLGTKAINEDQFLELIVQKSDPRLLKEKENKTPSPEKVEQKHEKKPEVKSEKKPEVKTEKKPEADKKESAKKPVLKSPAKLGERNVPKIPKIELSDKVNGEWSSGPHETQLWVDKYKPTSCKNIIGQQGDRSCMNKLKIWLRDWNKNHLHRPGKAAPKPAPWGASNDNGAWAKCALLSGPPGVGKTTTAYLVAQELGFDIVEMNASDTRSKRLLQENVSDTLNTTSVASLLQQKKEVIRNRVLLMDEVDGMAGNEDRGGVAELILLLKHSKVPVIAMCNDRNHPKIRSLANHCFDLRFHRPRPEQIKAAMMSVCFKEKIQIKPDALNEIIVGCGQDVRQVLHHLSMIKAGEHEEKMDAATAKKEANMSKKTSVKVGPWDVCKKVFSAEDHKTMSLFDKSDLYFYDYNLSGLFVQENYLSCTPQAAKGNNRKTMELIAKAADSLAEGDIVERGIRSGMNWSLLPTAAIFNSVLPGEYMSGSLHGQIQFPSWLGKNSRRNKIDRILQELQIHTRLSAGTSKLAFNLDYSQSLRDHITRPLRDLGMEGVDLAVEHMEKYSLLREDLDGLIEVAQWPDRPDPLRNVDSKTKAAFTRKYNKDNALLPYSVVQNVKKKAKEPVEGLDEEDEEVDDQEDESVEADAMIKVKKPKAGASKAKEDKGKGEGKGKGKGKGKQK